MTLTEWKPCNANHFYHSRIPATKSPIQTSFMQPSLECCHVKISLLLLIINVNSILRTTLISPGSKLLKLEWPTKKLDYALFVLVRISAMTPVSLNSYGWSCPDSLNFWDREVDILDFFQFSLRCFWSHLREIKMKPEARLMTSYSKDFWLASTRNLFNYLAVVEATKLNINLIVNFASGFIFISHRWPQKQQSENWKKSRISTSGSQKFNESGQLQPTCCHGRSEERRDSML